MLRIIRSSVVVVVAMGLAGLTVPPGYAQGGKDPRLLRERPDDPPGVPARPPVVAPAVTNVVRGDFTSIQVNTSAGVNIPLDAANEPSIAVDPNSPNTMVIGWRQFDTILSNFREAGFAYTVNGGRSWIFGGVLEDGVFRSDPVLGAAADGNFYYNSLTLVGGTDMQCDVFKSTNGGQSWGPAKFAYGGDKQWMTIDRTGGMGHGYIYHNWSIASNLYGLNTFSRSIDGGNTFSTPSVIPNQPIWGTNDVAPDGTLWICGVDASVASTFYVAKSTNAQDTSVAPTFTTTMVNLGGNIKYFVGGPNPGGLYGQVQIGIDKSDGPYAGNIYVLCSVDPPGGDPIDVHIIRSTDGGTTWSLPVTVNDDGGNLWQWFGTMSVAPNGRIDVVWNDTRNSGGNERLSETYYAYSIDGGQTFSTNIPISPQWDSHLGWPNQDKIGDYYHMISDDVGANLAYAATFNDEQDVYYCRIGDYDCNSNGVPDSVDIAYGNSYDQNGNGILDECEPGASDVAGGAPSSGTALGLNAPNPFNPSTTVPFTLARAQRVAIHVFDVHGGHVATLVDEWRAAGPHAVTWNGRDHNRRVVGSGIYFCRMMSEDGVQTRKMVLLK